MAAEQILQSKIKKYLIGQGWIVIKTIQLSDNGYPDLFCFKNGITVFIEVKAKGKVPTELQLYRISELKKQGFTAFWTDDFKNICNFIKIH
jgi:Holliday junction resolvase